jgi:hypothetical protein
VSRSELRSAIARNHTIEESCVRLPALFTP